MGKISQLHGAQLERYLDNLNTAYTLEGRAHIFKVPTPIMPGTGYHKTSQTRRGKSVYVDYAGTIDGGISVALEAKHTCNQGPSFAIKAITDYQQLTLAVVHRLGGIAAVFVRHVRGMQRDDYLVPWVYIDGVLGIKKSFRWDEVGHFKIPADKTWLDACDSIIGWSQPVAWACYCADGWPWVASNE